MVSSLQVMLFLARTIPHAGCKGWLKQGQPEHPSLPILSPAMPVKMRPSLQAISWMLHPSVMPAHRLHPHCSCPALQCARQVFPVQPGSISNTIKQNQQLPHPSPAASTETLHFRLFCSSRCSAEEASTQRASPPGNIQNKGISAK